MTATFSTEARILSPRTQPPLDALTLASDHRLQLFVFDRDKTLVDVPEGIHHLCSNDPIEFVPGVIPFLKRLRDAGVRLVAATNQPGVEEPHVRETLAKVNQFHRRLQEHLADAGVVLDAFYVCPHVAKDHCHCRKPRAGMFLQAMHDFRIAPGDSAAIGDRLSDVWGAHRAGIEHLFLLSPWAQRLGPLRAVLPCDVIPHPEDAWGLLAARSLL